ncbi:MAG: aspartate/glutamate racemase family protein [Clostridia bacterium]|nr:aspartate/glutamate racemase family protein [Clostridia bacterium]
MKTIGLIGGMSWESTVTYYELMNRITAEKLGGFHSARILMYNVDFAEIEANMTCGDWDANAEILADAAMRLEKAGADFIVIATNTIHKLVPAIEKRIGIPILHIADAAAEAVKRDGIGKVGLLGTKVTMTQGFIRDRLTAAGLEVIVPDGQDIDAVNDIIFNELCHGKVLDLSREKLKRIISGMAEKGAGGVILGCTEIGMLISGTDSALKVYDTTVLHATKAAEEAIGTVDASCHP